jgi:tripartite-type tricarboxylate transporter receptor subunit TctC
LTRHPDLPDVPTARELIKDPATLAMLEFAEIPFFMALPFVAPPDIPADRAQALQSAFMQMAKDPQFLEDAERSKFEISAIDGAAVRSLVQKMAATPKDVVKSYAEVVSSGREAK